MTSDVLLTTDLHYSYQGKKVLFDVNVCVQKGDMYGCLGPNGAGKTTLLKCLLGLLPVREGHVTIFGSDDPIRRKQHVGSLIETPAFVETMTAEENLHLFQLYNGYTSKSAIRDTLNLVDLFERRADVVGSYSLGMKQRLGIARALMNEPKLLILDEPTNGLDPKGMNDIRLLLQQLNSERGITVVLSSHLLHEIELLCNRVCIIDDGVIRFQGTTDTLQQRDDLFRISSEDNETLVQALQRLSVAILKREPTYLEIQSQDIAALNRSLHRCDISLTRIEPIHQSLEDSFLQITENQS